MQFSQEQIRGFLGSSPSRQSSPGTFSQSQIRSFLGVAAPVQKPRQQIFQGGFLQDIFDALQLPQYAATGALSKKYSIGEAIKNRVAPSEALNIVKPGQKNSFGRSALGFAADVVLDPLNFLGIGALTKAGSKLAKIGKGAETLGEAGRLGQRSLLSVVNPLTGNSIAPLIGGAPVLEGLTKAGQAFKSTGPGAKLAEAFNVLPAISKGSDVESITKQLANVKNANLVSKGVERGVLGSYADLAGGLQKRIDAAVAEGTLTEKALGDILEKISNPRALVRIAPENVDLFKDIKKGFDDLGKDYTLAGGAKLDGKITTNIITKAQREAIKEGKVPRGLGGLKAGGEAGIEKFAGYTGFKSLDNSLTIAGKASGKTNAVLENGSKLKKIPDAGSVSIYATPEVIQAIEVAKAKAILAVKDLPQRERAAAIKEAVQKEIDLLKASQPQSFFTRTAMSARALNEAMPGLKSTTSFSENPIEAMLAQATGVAKMKARDTFSSLIREQGVGRVLAKGKKIPEGFERVDIKGLKDLVFEADVAKALRETNRAYTATGALKDSIDMFDKLQNAFKASATFVNPAFHTRNFVSNLWQLFLAGVSNPVDHARGVNVALQAFKAKQLGKPIEALMSKADAKLFRDMVENQGLLKVGPFTVDIETPTFKWTDGILELPGDIGEFVENAAKISLYSNRLRKGFAPAEAAKDVRKFLFDYSDLAPMEREVFKRVMPFYTWSRKNIPLQLAMLIQKPAKFSIVSKAKDAVEAMTSGGQLDERYLPEWLKSGYAVYLGKSENGLENYFKTEGYIPAIDVGRLSNPGRLVTGNISPLFKTPVELALNYNTFTGRPIKDYEGQKQFLGIPFTQKGVEIDPYLMQLLRTFRPFSESQKFVQDPAKSRGNQMSGAQALASYLIGKTYAIDPARQRNTFDYVQSLDVSKIKNDIEDAQKRGQTDAVARLYQLLQLTQSGQATSL